MKYRIGILLTRCRVLIIFAILALEPAHAKGEWLLFTDITATQRDLPASSADKMTARELDPSLTLFGNLNKERFQLLFEGLINKDEAEIERLQVGWNINQTNTLWFGRFHNPFDYWTSKFHHGRYFQTTQLRPGVVEFEDEGGVMPLHLAGFLLEGLYSPSGMGGIRYDLALGVGPRVGNDANRSALDAPTFMSPLNGRDKHKTAFTARIAYLPDAIGENEIGLFISRVIMPTEGLSFVHSDVTQTSMGLFGNWQNERIKLFGTAIFIRHELDMDLPNQPGHQPMRHNMASAYLQGEYTFTPRWRGYTRLEATPDAKDDAYVHSFAMFIKERGLLGFRYDFKHNQALKLEVSRAKHLHDDTPFNALSLQWSTLFP